jgi:hypothetical protein
MRAKAAIYIREIGAGGLLDEYGESAGPAYHPVHRHATQQAALRALEERVRAWVLVDETLLLAGDQLPQPGTIDRGHSIPFCRERALSGGVDGCGQVYHERGAPIFGLPGTVLDRAW